MSSLTAAEEADRIRNEVFQLRLERAVLVEGKTDKFFWARVLERAGAGNSFKIYAQVGFPSPITSGRSALIKHFLPFAARDLFICVDSELDYLAQNPLLKTPFVFQTKVHSIENYQCFAPSLNDILRQATDDPTAYFDFETCLTAYGFYFNRLVFQTLGLMHPQASLPPVLENIFQHRFVDLLNQVDYFPDAVELASLSLVQLPSLEREDVNEAQITRVKQLGLDLDTAYLFIRGHDVREHVLKLLKKVAEPITKAVFSQKPPAEKAAYQKHLVDNSFQKMLDENDRFSGFHLYQELVGEVAAAIG